MNNLDESTKKSLINFVAGTVQEYTEITRRLLVGESINYSLRDGDEKKTHTIKECDDWSNYPFARFCGRQDCRFNKYKRCNNEIATKNDCSIENNYMYFEEK